MTLLRLTRYTHTNGVSGSAAAIQIIWAIAAMLLPKFTSLQALRCSSSLGVQYFLLGSIAEGGLGGVWFIQRLFFTACFGAISKETTSVHRASVETKILKLNLL